MNQAPIDISILGIDPGSINSGYAIITSNAKKSNSLNNYSLIDYGTVTCRSKVKFYTRLGIMHNIIYDLIAKHNPNYCVFEDAYVGFNPRTSMKLGQIRGALLASALRHPNCKIHHLAPSQVKKSITGNGQSSKRQVSFFVRSLLNNKSNKTNKNPADLTEDAADALAIALGFAMHRSSINH